MTATIIDGRAVATRVRSEVADAVQTITRDGGRAPGLATILVGEDPASAIYVANKRKACAEAGIADLHRHLPAESTQDEIAEVIDEGNEDPAVSGILLQLPLPDRLDAGPLTARISPEKDVDGLTPISAGRLAQGLPGLRPCTPLGVIELLDAHDVRLEGAEAVVVGRSNLVGKPVAALLLARHATVTICHSRTRDLPGTCARADVLVAAVGYPGTDQSRLRQAWRGGDRRRNQPNRRWPARGRRLRRCARASRVADAGARRGRTNDDRHASQQHSHRGSAPVIQCLPRLRRPA